MKERAMRYSCFLIFIWYMLSFLPGCTVTNINYPAQYSLPAGIKDPTLVVYLVDPLFRIDFHGDLPESFGSGDQSEVIYQFFLEQLKKNIDSVTLFNNIDFDQLASNHAIKEVSVRIPARGEIVFELPADNETVTFSHSKADFVLFLDEVSIVSKYLVDESYSYEPVYDPYTGAMGRRRRHQPAMIKPTRDLIYESKFVLWDNIEKKTVSYGYVRAVEENKKAISEEDWLAVSQKHVKKLFEGTPFLLEQRTENQDQKVKNKE